MVFQLNALKKCTFQMVGFWVSASRPCENGQIVHPHFGLAIASSVQESRQHTMHHYASSEQNSMYQPSFLHQHYINISFLNNIKGYQSNQTVSTRGQVGRNFTGPGTIQPTVAHPTTQAQQPRAQNTMSTKYFN